MKTTLAFGSSGLDIDLPEGPTYQTVRAHSAGAIEDLTKALNNALDEPIGCAPLEQLARGRRTAAISVCDITRPVPNRLTLAPFLDRLHRAGLKPENITLCIATGLHRKATPAELQTILGPEIATRYPILNHDAKNFAAHTALGSTLRGTPVVVDSTFLEADLHLSLGFIEQHLMLGFSGGRKLIAPGLAGQETIKTIHSPHFMRESLATEGSIEGNPLHAELLEIAQMVRHDFLLDVTLTQSRDISGVFAGDPVNAHAAGVRFLRSSSLELLSQPVDAVITSAAGYPLDLTFYQTIKGITAVQHVVKPGGKILCVSECSEGAGSPDFAEMLAAYQGAQNFLDTIRNSPVKIDQWQLEKLAMVALKYELLFFTPGLAPSKMGVLGRSSFCSIEEALRRFLSELPVNARVAIFPDGPYAFARVKASV